MQLTQLLQFSITTLALPFAILSSDPEPTQSLVRVPATHETCPHCGAELPARFPAAQGLPDGPLLDLDSIQSDVENLIQRFKAQPNAPQAFRWNSTDDDPDELPKTWQHLLPEASDENTHIELRIHTSGSEELDLDELLEELHHGVRPDATLKLLDRFPRRLRSVLPDGFEWIERDETPNSSGRWLWRSDDHEPKQLPKPKQGMRTLVLG